MRTTPAKPVTTDVEYLHRAVERVTGSPATHFESVSVIATFKGREIWNGTVEVFLSNGGTFYGWAVRGEKEPRYLVSRKEPGTDSPSSAVKAWIASQFKGDDGDRQKTRQPEEPVASLS